MTSKKVAPLSRRSAIIFSVFGVIGTVHSILAGAVAAFLVYLLLGGHRAIRIISHTFRRDITAAIRFVFVNLCIYGHVRANRTVPQIFTAVAQKYPKKACLVNKEHSWTFREVEEYTNRVANCFSKLGFKAGDEVAIFMESKPEFVMLWLGLSKIGVVSALINNHLKSIPLAHSITCVNAKAIIFGFELLEQIRDARPLIQEKIHVPYYCFGGNSTDLKDGEAKLLQPLINASPNTKVAFKGDISDRLIYVYTSGTTGLPKAAIIKHSRYITCGAGIHYMLPIKEDDIIYLCLPLYHMACGILGLSQVIMFGATGVVSKFSASRFWEECAEYKCTVAHYIGETCRYLLTQPKKPSDRQHCVRMMFGNGLRAQIWTEFCERFGIKDVREVYGSTEGNSNFVNIDNHVGAVGFLPSLANFAPSLVERLYPVRLIKVDETTGMPIRDRNGLCIPCKPGETGEMVGLVRNTTLHKFDGYVSKDATKKKLYMDVFNKGDIAFSSGDLLVVDEYGYLYFKDRTGDTFRWKGENVSTSEVEGVITKIVGLSDVVVYGVQVPGAEGRAGMAAVLDPDHKLNLDKFLKDAQKVLPGYAIPLFIRLLRDIDSTGTYKLKKTELQKYEYCINHITDPIYFLDSSAKKYVLLDRELYDKIMQRKVRV